MASAPAVSVSRPSRLVAGGRRIRIRPALDRPRLWKVTTGLSALLLAAVVAMAAQGSVQVVVAPPGDDAGVLPAWTRWCGDGQVRADRRRIAYCARVTGMVLTSTHGPAPGESHIAVVGGFHLFVVRMPEHTVDPGVGSRVQVIGPLLRARDGEREVQAFAWWRR